MSVAWELFGVGILVAQIRRPLSAFSRCEEANRDGVLSCTEVLIDLAAYPIQDSLMYNVADVPLFSAGYSSSNERDRNPQTQRDWAEKRTSLQKAACEGG